ncbi:tRNA dihydrouridine synthase [Oceanobacter mangrovi]|uniref:tRNA dihydrouridine synthase n=1 Tax=Oceanobacter mangrovi TaxID=2862510 RepID=UPI001C8EF6B2|nr:tRNA-dihydrouridine synthase [Oceanobacter mangrovi]
MNSPVLPFDPASDLYIALAPMEGLMDHHFRELLTAVGGIDHCVTEFIRVSQNVYPDRVFYKYCPELKNSGKTLAGTPVHVQLLGSDPDLMAANAARAAKLGAPAIDLNFGCPAKTVNRSQGGAVLLQYTDRLHDIASAVRRAVPSHIPVSAKMRLGYLDKELALDNAAALASAGIQWLTVHARTKTEGYKPPAWWEWIGKITEIINIPVLANGEIWTPEHAFQCQQQSRTPLLMIGRGLVSTPDLGLQIRARKNGTLYQPMSWQDNVALVQKLAGQLTWLDDKQITDRMKQWLHYFSIRSAEMKTLFTLAKPHRSREEFFGVLEQAVLHGLPATQQ